MTRRIASLGMYDHPAQRNANDVLWAAIARPLRGLDIADVPEALDRTRDVHAVWRDPDLLFAQACGYPLVADPELALRVIALPVQTLPGWGDATHGSVVIARRGDPRALLPDFRGGRAAINDPRSNTGMNLLRAVVAPIAGAAPFFADVAATGSHRASVIAVGSGTADIAAIDAVTHATLERFEPELTAAVRIVARTQSSPTLPFVTAAGTDAHTRAALHAALDVAMRDPDLAEARATLFLQGAQAADDDALAPIAAIAAQAARAGYPALR